MQLAHKKNGLEKFSFKPTTNGNALAVLWSVKSFYALNPPNILVKS